MIRLLCLLFILSYTSLLWGGRTARTDNPEKKETSQAATQEDDSIGESEEVSRFRLFNRKNKKKDEEIILVDESAIEESDDEEKEGVVRKAVQDGMKDAKIGLREAEAAVSTDVLKWADITIGVKFKTNSLKASDLHNDMSKIYQITDNKGREGLLRWNKTIIEGKASIPFNIEVSNILGKLGFNLSLKPEGSFRYTLIGPSKGIFLDTTSIWRSTGEKIADVWRGVKAISIPMSSRKILEKLKPGQEFYYEGYQSLVTSTGLKLSAEYVSANNNFYLLSSSNTSRKLKFYEELGQKYVSLRYEQSKAKGEDLNQNLEFGVSLFETKLLNGVLDIALIANHQVTQSTTKMIYSFVFDMQYEEARKALDDALSGNLIKAQKLANWREDEREFQGVYLKAKRNDLIQTFSHKLNYGLILDDTEFKSKVGNLKLREKLGNALRFIYKKEKTDTQSELEDFYDNEIDIDSTAVSRKTESHVIWDSIVKRKSEAYCKAEVIKTQIINDETKITEEEIGGKLVYSLQLERINAPKHYIDDFFELSSLSLGISNPHLKSMIDAIENTQSCKHRSKINYQGVFYSKAIDRILSHSRGEMWKTLALLIGEHRTDLFETPEGRRKILRAYKIFLEHGNPDSYSELFQATYPDLKKRYDIFVDFVNNDIIWRILKAGEQKLLQNRLKALQDLLIDFKKDPTLFAFLVALASTNLPEGESPEDIFVKFTLKGKKCNYKWGLVNPSMHSTDQVSAEWQNL